MSFFNKRLVLHVCPIIQIYIIFSKSVISMETTTTLNEERASQLNFSVKDKLISNTFKVLTRKYELL